MPNHPSGSDDLLLTLEEISRLVSHSHDPHQTLTNIVRQIQDRFQTAVCSIYLLDIAGGDDKELVLAATVGLNSESVGQVRMKVGEGLTGRVAERSEPLMVEDAFAHPDFKFFPESGEEVYQSFLGIPLIDGGELVGVLVVQTREKRVFQSGEIRMLTIVGSQVAPLVDDARLLDQVIALVHQPPPAELSREAGQEESRAPTTWKGVPLSEGEGIGRAYAVDGFDALRAQIPVQGAGADVEKARLQEAMEGAREELEQLSRHLSELVGEDHGAILQAQLMIMQDHAIERDLIACLEAGLSAEGALFQTLDKYVEAFQNLSTPYFQERAYDIKDVFHRLLWQLQAPSREEGGSEPVVLLAHEASVMELFSIDLDRLAAVVVEHGSAQSHAAILARSLGIPMLSQVRQFSSLCDPGCYLHVDANQGIIQRCEAPKRGVARSVGAVPETVPLRRKDSFILSQASSTADAIGLPRLEVNINLLREADPAVALNVSGVGLFRSEFLFLARRTLPSEEEQVDVYRKLILRMEGRPVTIRTFDLRPDKLMAYSQLSSTTARPLDWRLVLESPPLQKLFHDQIRAILRAASPEEDPERTGSVRIVIPLVTHTELLDFVVGSLAQAKKELEQEELPFEPGVSLGIMIEVAAATTMLDLWSEQVDFFALGTNDLTASALGIDREHGGAGDQADPLHPGLLRLIHDVVEAAHSAHRPITVCGELAADPEGSLALAALNVDALSVPVRQYQAVQQHLAQFRAGQLRDVAGEIIRQRTAGAVRSLLQKPVGEG